MQSEKSFELRKLKKILKNILSRNEIARDLILFGSAARRKARPNDIDIAAVVSSKNRESLSKLSSQIKREVKNVHIEFLLPEDIYATGLAAALITEGISIKHGERISSLASIRPAKLYSYSLKEMPHTEKVKFNKALVQMIKKTGSEKLGAGVLMVPMEKTDYAEEFFDVWGLGYKGKAYTIF